MPRKTPVVRQNEWLDMHEKGKSVAAIARESHRDVRTVNRGIDQARRQRDAGWARAELMKEALSNHHKGLLDILAELIAELTVPAVESVPLPWQGKGGVLQSEEAARKGNVRSEQPVVDVTLRVEKRIEWGLLQEHLRRDPLWKVVAQYQKALAAYLEALESFQIKTVSLLREKTGYRLVESGDSIGPPSVFVDATGPLFYEVTIRRVMGQPDQTNPEGRMVSDPTTGEVRHGMGRTLAKAPGEEEKCTGNLREVLRLLRESPEAAEVVKKYKVLQESAAQAKRVA